MNQTPEQTLTTEDQDFAVELDVTEEAADFNAAYSSMMLQCSMY